MSSQHHSSPDRVSPSILIPESPGSPNIFDHPSPGPQDLVFPGPQDLASPEPQHSASPAPQDPASPGPQDPAFAQDSETYTQQDRPTGNVVPAGDTVSENSNDSMAINHDSNQMVRTVDAVEDNTRDSIADRESVYNEDSNAPSSTQESNLSLPETHIRKHCDHEDEPPAKVRKINSPQKNDDLDGETCPICLDTWGNSGDHRLVALKCGHLFGSECVERWLKAQAVKDRSCPTCKSKAAMRDIRFIYARRLVAADTSQITALQKQVETLQSEKSRTELELQKAQIAHRACLARLELIKSTYAKVQVAKEQIFVRKSWRFALEKNLEVCKDGGCRVLTYNCRTYELYVSQKSTNYLFPGYGIRKVSCVDYKLGQFVHLHPKPIRDISYSMPSDLLLSVGLDGCARIVDRGIPSTSLSAGFALWSCAWDYSRSNVVYMGGVGGVIHQYDCRNTSRCLQTLNVPGDMSPVVSLCSTEFGLISCQLNTCNLWMDNGSQWEPRPLPVEGSFMSLSYDNESQRALISVRPSANGLERSRLSVCKLKMDLLRANVVMSVEDTFMGSARSSLMSRAAWVKAPGSLWAAAHSESDSALYLNGIDGARTMSLPAAEPALDVCSVSLNGNSVLAALSESRLRLYKGVASNF